MTITFRTSRRRMEQNNRLPDSYLKFDHLTQVRKPVTGVKLLGSRYLRMKIFWNILWGSTPIYNWISTYRSPLRCKNLTFRNIFSYLLAIYPIPHFLQFNHTAKAHSVWSLGYGLNSRVVEVRFLARKNFISSLKRINRYGDLLTAYVMAAGGSLP
jgi:hypothetical protein